MSAGVLEGSSPSIFEKTLSFPLVESPTPSEPDTDNSHRFYTCEKVESMKHSSYTCQKKKFQEINRLQGLPGKTILSIKKGCPEWNDTFILSWKLRARARIQ